ncbi:MAG TPA: phosphate/phosphite/phosphonate ABC transporter substrate-binding protein [Candidatus Binatia bacterium]|jgi:phosphonate transport system substrate-binding protein
MMKPAERHPNALIYGVAVLIFLLAPGAETSAQTGAKTISLGVVSQRPQAGVEPQFRDFARYVARKISPALEGRVMVAPSVWQLATLLEKNEVDFYMDSPYPTYLINRQGAAIALLRRWKGGAAEYRGVIFTKKGSGVDRLEDLRGRLLAFEDPGSTSGYFLPKIFLVTNGLKLAEKTGVDATVAPAEVGYVFTYSAAKIADLVLSRQLDAGAFSNEDYDRLDAKKKSDAVVLGVTEYFPRHFLSIRKELDPVLANRLEEILLSMHQDPEGRAILQKLDNTTKFDVVPGGDQAVRLKLQEVFGLR